MVAAPHHAIRAPTHNARWTVALACVVVASQCWAYVKAQHLGLMQQPDYTPFDQSETYFPDVIISYASCTGCPASASIDTENTVIGGSWCRAKPIDNTTDTYTCGSATTGPLGERLMWAVANVLQQNGITSFNGRHVQASENWKVMFYSKL